MEFKTWAPFAGGGGAQFLVKALVTEEQCSVLVTDHVHIWGEDVPRAVVSRRNADLNPTLELQFARILVVLRTHLEEQRGTARYTFERSADGEALALTMAAEMAMVRFHWRFACKRRPQEDLHRHLTHPLMVMVEKMHKDIVGLKVGCAEGMHA